MVMHPIKPELDGKSLSDMKDPNGKRIFVESTETAKTRGAGYVEYMWPKPGFAKPVPKMSYVKLVKEWGWVVGSGIYVDDVQAETTVVKWKIFAATFVFGLIVLACAWLISRKIKAALDKAVDHLGLIASGDLTSHIEATSADETGRMLIALKEMNTSLSHIVGEVRGGSDFIASATKQIAVGNADLSQRTEEQAAALEETAASMEELTSTIKQNADNAQQANQLAVSASSVAMKGGEVIGRVVTTMSAISGSSRKISDIIGVIDGIAFQTNILALNAAVEAARAGEQGRGFAVVAAEVRSLAQRSAAAAKEIKTLINDSVDRVEGGSRLVAEAGQTMQEIVTSIKRVTDIMAEISAASQEQSKGIEQVNIAITQMDDVTQQNAALVEESAAAAESLEEQAHSLVDVISRFKLQETHATSPVRVVQMEKKTQTHAPVARIPRRGNKSLAANGYHKEPDRELLAEPMFAVTAVGQGQDWKEF
jgi:methyl-accepting chemotaxis protein